ncbi:MAG: serine/threonine-protein kinase, partial [Acidobacteria bacterium]
MTLHTGQMLSHYRLVEQIGEGGMGVVWKAFDQTLAREVAIKVLPDEVTHSPERTGRFEREARLLAALNHPNVATVHGFERAGEHAFLVLELVSGDGLDQMLAGGPLPLSETLEMALQVAQGLEAAHEKGIIHRDLKPANIKMSETGAAKILDFGLAKAMQPEPGANPSSSPTITTGGTRAGAIFGTPAYMSPEQARGRPMDRRTDIWSFGCVLFECLAGQSPFNADTVGDAIARILEREPDWALLPQTTPPAIRRLLERCLRKDHRQRLRDIGDARIVIGEQLSDSAAGDGSTATSDIPTHLAPAQAHAQLTTGRSVLAIGLAVLASGAFMGAAATWALRPQPAPRMLDDPLHVSLPLIPDTALRLGHVDSVDISPDGRKVAYAVTDSAQISSLAIQDLVTGQHRLLPGTRGAYGPFFSPDGRWVAYFDWDSTGLMKVSVDGGAPVEICKAPVSSRGGVWSQDDRIIFAPSYNQSLYVVPASGGTSAPLTRLREGEKSHRQPEILPDGETVLFVIGTADLDFWDDADIASVSLSTGEIKIIVKGGFQPRWSPTGHVLYARAGALYAVSYDPVGGKTGVPFEVLSDLSTDPIQSPAHYSLSRNDALVFVPGGVRRQQNAIIAIDREGNEERLDLPVHSYSRVTTSPDGTRLALQVERANSSIWTYDLHRRTLSRLTTDRESEMAIWSPDSDDIFYGMTRGGRFGIYRRPSDGGGEVEMVFETSQPPATSGISPDGRFLVFSLADQETDLDIWIAPLADLDATRPILNSRYAEIQPIVSPDGRRLAYASNRSGRLEIYVTSFPDGGRRWLVSRDGGEHPLWSPDGEELYFRQGNRMMAARIEPGKSFFTGPPFLLFETRGMIDPIVGFRTSDLHPDGRFLLFRDEEPLPPTMLGLILNFSSLLKKKASGS